MFLPRSTRPHPSRRQLECRLAPRRSADPTGRLRCHDGRRWRGAIENSYIVTLVTVPITHDRPLIHGSKLELCHGVRSSAAAQRKATGESSGPPTEQVGQRVAAPVGRSRPPSCTGTSVPGIGCCHLRRAPRSRPARPPHRCHAAVASAAPRQPATQTRACRSAWWNRERARRRTGGGPDPSNGGLVAGTGLVVSDVVEATAFSQGASCFGRSSAASSNVVTIWSMTAGR